jgi:hypothetical protein
MSDTGPTGPAEPTDATGPTGPTETTDATGPVYQTIALLPETETAPIVVQPPPIATLDELMASHAVLVAKETADRAALAPLTAPTPEAYRPQLFAWAAAGFPGIYVVQSFNLTPPNICSDGVTRDVANYAWYLLGVEISSLLANIQSLLTGITVSYSFEGNALRIHVSKA